MKILYYILELDAEIEAEIVTMICSDKALTATQGLSTNQDLVSERFGLDGDQIMMVVNNFWRGFATNESKREFRRMKGGKSVDASRAALRQAVKRFAAGNRPMTSYRPCKFKFLARPIYV